MGSLYKFCIIIIIIIFAWCYFGNFLLGLQVRRHHMKLQEISMISNIQVGGVHTTTSLRSHSKCFRSNTAMRKVALFLINVWFLPIHFDCTLLRLIISFQLKIEILIFLFLRSKSDRGYFGGSPGCIGFAWKRSVNFLVTWFAWPIYSIFTSKWLTEN